MLIDGITGNLAQLTARSLVKKRVFRAKRLFEVSDRLSVAAAAPAIQARLQNPLARKPSSAVPS